MPIFSWGKRFVFTLFLLLVTVELCSSFISSQNIDRASYCSSRLAILDNDRDSGPSTSDEAGLRKEAEDLLDKARALRSELPEATRQQTSDTPLPSNTWNVSPDAPDGVDYRLYVDIGREDGTWMDPRWGASGRRIEFSLDVRFAVPAGNNDALANKEERERMVKDNFGGTSSDVWVLSTASVARLRQGFDKMKCYGGAYRIDRARNGGNTARFYIAVEGTPEDGSPHGDLNIPRGMLYFSLPVFGGVNQLSKKEGLVTIRQIGWHTGWRREESRMVGTVRAVSMEDAKRRDGF